MKLGIAPVIFEDGGQLRDYVSVKDVARANVMMLENRAQYETFNVGGGMAISVLEFANAVQKGIGTKTGYRITGEYRVGDTRHSVSDISKIKKLGWRPKGNIEESIREYCAWIKDIKIDKAKLIAADRKMRKVGMVRKAKG